MKRKNWLALVAVFVLIASACGDDSTPDTTATQPTTAGTTAPTTAAPTTPTTEAPMAPLAFDVGFDEATGTINLGVLAAITGPIAGIGQSVLAGHKVYWNSLNANGGVAGMYPVNLVVKDNAYNPETNVLVYNEVKDEVLAFSSVLGTPPTATIYEDAATQNILVAAGSLASQWALTDNVVLNLASGHYFAQFANASYWAMNIADPPVMTADSVVGLIYQADDYGQDCKNGYEFGQANTGFNAAYEATYAAGDADFSAQIAGAQAAGVDVLFVCTVPPSLGPMLGTAAALTYSPTVFGSSPSYNPVLPGALGGGDEAAGLALFGSFPYYGLGAGPTWEDDTNGMAALRADREAFGADVPDEVINAFYYFGYTQARTFHTILEAAVAAGDITRAGVIAAVNSITAVDFEFGMGPAGYGPTPKDRLSTNFDIIGVPVSVTERVFGFEPVSDWYVAPYMADWDPAG